MKRITTPAFYLCCGLMVTLAVINRTHNADSSNTAIVNRVNGLHVFTDSYPVSQYEVLGAVKTNAFDGQYSNVRDALIKKAKKEFPGADGIIVFPNQNGSDRAEVVKFK